jgi:multidrug efflux pump subunit AcrB
MFVDTFIRRPILASVCSLVIVLAGALAIPNMPIAWYPDVTPPTVSVTALYTGANSETVETAVTTPLEQAINGVEGMLYMTSSSSNGTSTITVTFDVTRDPDIAAVDVQNRVNQAIGRLPAEVRQLGVTVQGSLPNPAGTTTTSRGCSASSTPRSGVPAASSSIRACTRSGGRGSRRSTTASRRARSSDTWCRRARPVLICWGT